MYVCGECAVAYERGGYCPADGASLALSDDPLLGTEVLRYRIARAIGEGATGKVYLAIQPQIGSRVAIKILSAQCASRPDLLERFFAEGRAVNLIRHENIISVIDMAQLPDGRPLIVMEFIDGSTLSKQVRNGHAPLGGVVRVMSEVLSALDAAHSIGIVHRDLKPDNIMITAQGRARVLDFGIAKLAPNLTDAVSQRTRTGVLLGTPAYMAPEQISAASEIDARSDVYAAGVVLFEAVTGKVPFTGATLFDLMRAHVDEPPPSPRGLRPDLPLGIEQVILTALAKKPEHRFQSAAAMAQALAYAAAELPTDQWRDLSTRPSRMSVPPTPMPMPTPTPMLTPTRMPTTMPMRMLTPMPSPTPAPRRDRDDTPAAHSVTVLPTQAPRRRRPLVIAIGAAIVAVGAVIALLALRVDEPSPPAPPASSATSVAAAPNAAQPNAAPNAAQPNAAQPNAAQPNAARAPVAVAPPTTAPPAVAAPTTSGRPGATKPATDQRTANKLATAKVAADPRTADELAGAKPAATAPLAPTKIAPAATTDPPAQPWLATPWITKARYNAKQFNIHAFHPQAQALARRIFEDAKLLEVQVYEVFEDGHIDLTQASDRHDTFFAFRSEKVTKLGEGDCVVVVKVEPAQVLVYIDNTRMCFQEYTALPRCPISWVFEKARAHGSKVTHAGLGYDHGRWLFRGDIMYTIDDDCP